MIFLKNIKIITKNYLSQLLYGISKKSTIFLIFRWKILQEYSYKVFYSPQIQD